MSHLRWKESGSESVGMWKCGSACERDHEGDQNCENDENGRDKDGRDESDDCELNHVPDCEHEYGCRGKNPHAHYAFELR